MILYRYFKLSHGLEALQTGRWKIGRLTELNDPLDCTPRILPSGTAADTQVDLLEVADGLLRSMSCVAGLLCFSKVVNDPVIWSHYADAHYGLALGFDFSEEDEPPLKVDYADDRPGLNLVELLKFQAAADETVRKQLSEQMMIVYRTKASSWKYEQEFRAFIDLERCWLVGSHYFSNFPAKQLRQVVLGARCAFSISDIKRILRKGPRSDGAAAEGYGQVEVKKCVADTARFTLTLKDDD